jgi:predicted GNAT superfamily acetyltransferase
MTFNTSQSSIIIRDFESIAEMRAVEEMQKEIWGCADREVVPLLTLIPSIAVGGILVGAFDKDELVGFAYGFIGYEDREMTLHSDMLAVKPAYRDHQLGFKLKLAQRERAIAQGIKRMTWTFDPLQSRNAHLNFAKLGVVADCYKINFYGETTSSFLHRHMGTDRLWVSWLLKSARVGRRIERLERERDSPIELRNIKRLVRADENNFPMRSEWRAKGVEQIARFVGIEIPNEIGSLQQQQPDLAVRWREATRAAFIEALAVGYIVIEFYGTNKSERGCGVYLLTQSASIESFVE